MGAGSTLIYRLEVPNPQGLDNKQLFLTNHDLEPVEEGRRRMLQLAWPFGAWLIQR